LIETERVIPMISDENPVIAIRSLRLAYHGDWIF